jgi:hypothetical protein
MGDTTTDTTQTGLRDDSSNGTGSGQEGGRRKTAWMTHVKATMRANKGKSLMQVLKMAKKTYKKSKKGMRGGSTILTPAPTGGRRRGSRKTRRSRRGGNME